MFKEDMQFLYKKKNLNIPLSINYAISPDESFLVAINENNKFSLYFLEDIGFENIICFYPKDCDQNCDIDVSAATFVEISHFHFLSYYNNNQSEKFGPNFQKSLQSFNNCNSQLVIANNDKPSIQIFDLSNHTFSNVIKVANPIISMKTDKLDHAQIFYIEKHTRNLRKYNFNSTKDEFISNNVNFFEELLDGSLIISTQTGIKYLDKQANVLNIQQTYLKPIAFFSLSYKKVLMIGLTNSCYPSFTVFDPLSKNQEPIYKLPYFKINDQNELFQDDNAFCCSNDGNKSFYIGSSFSNYIVHCISEGGFYSIEKVENVNFPVLALHHIKVNNGILAVFGKSNITLLKYLNNMIDNDGMVLNSIYNNDAQNRDKLNEEIFKKPENQELIETYNLIKSLPEPSDPLRAIRFLISESSQILKSSDSLEKNIQLVLKEQIAAYNLSSQLGNTKEWKPNDSKHFLAKIEIEKAQIEHILNIHSNQKSNDKKSFSFDHRFSYNLENAIIDDDDNKNKK